MTIVFFVALLLYLVVCGVLISLILAQEGKGGGLSGVMGSSMGETFGFGGANKTIKKFTSISATIFLVLSVILTFIGDGMVNHSADAFVGSESPATATPAPGAKSAAGSPAPGSKAAETAPGAKAPDQAMVVKTETGPAAPAAGANAPAAANTAAGPAPKMPAAAAPAAPAAPQPASTGVQPAPAPAK